jgi:hypothetical protein
MVKWIITRSFYLLIPGSNPGTPVDIVGNVRFYQIEKGKESKRRMGTERGYLTCLTLLFTAL